MRPEDFSIQLVVDFLQGTAMTLSSALETLYPGMDEDDLTQDDHSNLDELIFNCETCGWWCETSERDEESNCEDCSELKEDEDDED
jgi:hypothetical protein